MKVVLTFLLCGLSTTLWAQAKAHTFTSPDGAFRFTYPDSLVHCTPRRQLGGSVSWIPEHSCEAYSPVCDDPSAEGSTTIVCLAYPREKFEGYPGFEAAAFSVAEIRQAVTQTACLTRSPHWVSDPQDPRGTGKTRNINHASFAYFETSGVGAGNSIDEYIYRSFHRNTCSQLTIRIATANQANFEPPIKDFTEKDFDEVKRRLEQVLKSFSFLK